MQCGNTSLMDILEDLFSDFFSLVVASAVNDIVFGFIVFSWQVTVALEVSAHLAAATAEIKRWLPRMLSFFLDINESKIKISN